MARSQPASRYRKAENDTRCWKINYIGGELKAGFYGMVEPQKVIRSADAAVKRLLGGAVYILVHHSVAEETLKRLAA